MIPIREKIINKLLGTITMDSKDNSVLHIDMDNAVKVLTTFKVLVPYMQFETALNMALEEKIVGKVPVERFTTYAIACILLDIAMQLRVDESKLVSAINSQESKEEIEDMPKAVSEWREGYYGNLSAKEREDLADKMSNRLRPDIIEQIRYPGR